MKPRLEEVLDWPLEEILPFIQRRIMSSTTWFGVKALKNPMDFWVYQEVMHAMRADVVVELGTNWGGTTLALAHLLDLMGHGRVITVDIDQSKVPDVVRNHPRVTMFEGDACERYADVAALISETDRTLVIEDSSHTYDNTLACLRKYGGLTRVGDYFIVEDSICRHGLDLGPAPGPYEAVETFVEENSAFEVDRSMESFVVTWNPKGFLKRVSE